MRHANDGLRFVLELGLLTAFAYWGWTEGDGWWRWVLAVLAPLAVAALWGKYLAPKSDSRVSDPWRLLVEVALFGGATAALVRADAPVWAAVFGGLAALHLILTFVVGQRGF
ncbi:MAG: YrdB family protein [Gaiellaceae bacterium]